MITITTAELGSLSTVPVPQPLRGAGSVTTRVEGAGRGVPRAAEVPRAADNAGRVISLPRAAAGLFENPDARRWQVCLDLRLEQLAALQQLPLGRHLRIWHQRLQQWWGPKSRQASDELLNFGSFLEGDPELEALLRSRAQPPTAGERGIRGKSVAAGLSGIGGLILGLTLGWFLSERGPLPQQPDAIVPAGAVTSVWEQSPQRQAASPPPGVACSVQPSESVVVASERERAAAPDPLQPVLTIEELPPAR